MRACRRSLDAGLPPRYRSFNYGEIAIISYFYSYSVLSPRKVCRKKPMLSCFLRASAYATVPGMKYFKKLVGEKVYLSPMNSEDAERYTEWLNDLATTINLSSAPKVISLEAEREFLQSLAKEGYNFAIVRKENDELIGNCGLLSVDQVQQTAELGIFIGEAESRGQGYGSEAILLLLDFAFNLLNLHTVFLRVREFNEKARRVYEKLGFREIGRRRECVRIGGKYYDDIYMDILDREFEGKIPELLQS